MPRLFVGIDLPAEVKRSLSQLCTGMPDVRWVEPEKFHLTLRFIGEVDEPMASQIAVALQRIEAPAFALTLTGVGHFRERNLWVGVERNSALMSLQAKIERAMQEVGLPADPRSFTPHVKLARIKRSTGLRAFLSGHADIRIGPLDIRQFSLIESQRDDHRTVYTHRADYPLLCNVEPRETGMSEAALFEERIDTNRGHGCVTIRAELGSDGAIEVAFRGRDAPTVVYQYNDPADVLALGTALIKAAEAARAAAGTETG